MSQWSIDKRPAILSDMYGLTNVKNYFYSRKDEFPSAVLLKGQFGNGKTTTSKILAKMMVCQNPSVAGDPCSKCPSCLAIDREKYDRDVIAIDGGQAGKAEVVDTIREFIATAPMFDKRKVVIIEEIQELSTAAKNSLLKTLEHPRKNVHFILLTMQHTGNSGFNSRCVPFNFKKLGVQDIMMYLKTILESENLWEGDELPKEFKFQGLGTIAQTCGGSLRQALQVMELCIHGGYFTAAEIEDNVGLVDDNTIINILVKLANADDEAWMDVFKYDVSEFFNLGLKIITDAKVYKVSNYLANESYPIFIANNKRLVAQPNFDELAKTFIELSRYSKPYLRKSELVGALVMFYDKVKTKPASTVGVTRLVEDKKPVVTRNIPTRNIAK